MMDAELNGFNEEQIMFKMRNIEKKKFDGLKILDEEQILHNVLKPQKPS